MHPVLESVLALFHHEIVGHIDVTKSKHDHQQRACPYTDVTKDILEPQGACFGIVEVKQGIRHCFGIAVAVQLLIILEHAPLVDV